MIPESLSFKALGMLGGMIAGLTVLVRLGRLLEALETVQARQAGLEAKMDRALEAIAKLQGQAE